AAGDLRGDVRLLELLLEDHPRLADVLLAVGPPLGDHRLDLRVLARVQRLERQVLELPLERVDAEPVRKRRVHLERLARLLHLFLLAEVLDRPQVVEAVGELDQDHAHVLGHRDDQLPVVLGLRVLAALELDSGQLGDAVDELRDLVAELVADRLQVRLGVLDDVVEERGGDRRLVQPQLREDLRDSERVVDELLPRPALLALVRLRREGERACDQVAIEIGLVALDRLDQLIDQLLMTFRYLEYGHINSVLRAFGAKPSVLGTARRRKNHLEPERDDLAKTSSHPQAARRPARRPARRSPTPRGVARRAAPRAASGTSRTRAGSATVPPAPARAPRQSPRSRGSAGPHATRPPAAHAAPGSAPASRRSAARRAAAPLCRSRCSPGDGTRRRSGRRGGSGPAGSRARTRSPCRPARARR